MGKNELDIEKFSAQRAPFPKDLIKQMSDSLQENRSGPHCCTRSTKQYVIKLACESDGKNLAENMHNKIPLIYSSLSNLSLAYNWKIKMNETAKIPAFYNVFPELNHNEMTGFDVVEGTHLLSKNMSFIFLKDRSDNERIQKRMDITETLLEERGFEVIVRELSGKTTFEKIVTTLLTADWTALHLSRMYGTEAEKVPMVEELKKIMRK